MGNQLIGGLNINNGKPFYPHVREPIAGGVVLTGVAPHLPSEAAENNLIGSSSTISHESTFTLTADGISFGTKPAQTPYLHDDGAGPILSTLWDDWQGTGIAYQSDGFRSVSLPNSRMAGMISGERLVSPFNNFLIKNFTPDSYPFDIYGSYYYQFDPAWNDIGDAPGDKQWKPWALGEATWYDVPHVFIGMDSIDSGGETIAGPYRNSGDPGWPGGGFGSNAINPIGRWVRIEYQVRMDPTAGFLDFWDMSSGLRSALLAQEINGPNTTFGAAGTQSYVMHGGYIRDFDPGNFTHFTDLFMDFGMARVVLGNNATYASCDIREPQPYTAWSASSITLTANLGGLSAGTVYMYFVDDSGVVGGPLTLTAA